jgi:hypothetical protein
VCGLLKLQWQLLKLKLKRSGWSRPMMGRRNKLRCPLNGGTWRQSSGAQVVSLSIAPGSTARQRTSYCIVRFGVF